MAHANVDNEEYNRLVRSEQHFVNFRNIVDLNKRMYSRYKRL